MNNKQRGKEIRQQILSEVRHHSDDLARHIAQVFSITPQAVHNHIKRLEGDGWLSSTGTGKGKRYFPGDKRAYKSLFHLTQKFTEDAVWRDEYAFIFEDLPENIVDICHYGFTEMTNNAIDHSGGRRVVIAVVRNTEDILISVIDDGEGIFKKIKRLCGLPDERQALFELSKGKLTTDPANHTGEGIFFTSRIFDQFEIESAGAKFSHDDEFEFDYISESQISENKVGTAVYMLLKRDSERDVQNVFDDFAGPDQYIFNKTVIPMRLAQYGNEKLVSRSQAKRLLARIEKFQYVVFDFAGVLIIGQAFADEIFRVYAKAHPEIVLLPDNMQPNVEKMVKRAIANA